LEPVVAGSRLRELATTSDTSTEADVACSFSFVDAAVSQARHICRVATMGREMREEAFDPDPLAVSRRRSATELQVRFAIERRQIAYVAYRDEEDALQLFELDRAHVGEIVIGRAGELDISLRWDSDVSRVHATIKLIGAAWVLADVGSRNGTFVNEQRLIDSYKLIDRDLIRVGETHLAYRAAIPEGRPAAVEATATRTSTRHPPATISGEQKRVLVELCRPLLESDGLPASTPTNSEIGTDLSAASGVSGISNWGEIRCVIEKAGPRGVTPSRRLPLRARYRSARSAWRKTGITASDVTHVDAHSASTQHDLGSIVGFD
jgi:pSer/pThr/pTyr-binding forkhead associated (FHA) protein